MKTKNSIRKYALFLLCIFTLIFFATALDLASFAFAKEAGTMQTIKLNFLKRIEGTPFAEKVQARIEVPVYASGEIKIADVKKALRIKSFGVMQSYCDGFTYDKVTDEYTAVYNPSVYLHAKTVDGNGENFFLDCNVSFSDFFLPYVEDGLIEAKAYGTLWNNIKFEYSVLEEKNYVEDDIYGYFGFIPIPESYTLNAAFTKLFTSTNYKGEMQHFKYDYSLSREAYDKLLRDYDYGWLYRVWNEFVNDINSGAANATFYLIYVDSEDRELLIAENGAESIDDNRGAIAIGIEKLFSNPKNTWTIIGIVFGVLLLVAMIMVIVLAAKSIAKTVTKNAVKNGNRKR